MDTEEIILENAGIMKWVDDLVKEVLGEQDESNKEACLRLASRLLYLCPAMRLFT